MTDIIKWIMVAGGFVTVFVIKMFYPDYKDDNALEEAVESYIKYETNIDVDLSPLSPEDK